MSDRAEVKVGLTGFEPVAKLDTSQHSCAIPDCVKCEMLKHIWTESEKQTSNCAYVQTGYYKCVSGVQTQSFKDPKAGRTADIPPRASALLASAFAITFVTQPPKGWYK